MRRSSPISTARDICGCWTPWTRSSTIRHGPARPTSERRRYCLSECKSSTRRFATAYARSSKRARYAAEVLKPAFGSPAKEFAQAMESVWNLLGDHQETAVARDVVLSTAERAHAAGEPGFSYGRLHALEEAQAQADDDAFGPLWDEVSQKRLRTWLKN